MSQSDNRDIYKLQTLNRAFAILDLLLASSVPVGLSEIANGLKLHKSTTHRFLMVLEHQRMVMRTSSGKFRLGLRLFDYGSRALDRYDLRECSRNHLKALVQEVQETAHLCVLENMHMVYIEKVEPERSIRMISKVGASIPIHCTAVGKAILASMHPEDMMQLLTNLRCERFTRNTLSNRDELLRNLARVRRRGYAVDDEEHEEGVRCVAVAIQDGNSIPVAAVSVSGPTFRVTSRQVPFIVGKLVECAQGIRRDMGYVGRSDIPAPKPSNSR